MSGTDVLDYKLQFSYKFGPGGNAMVNVRAQDADELEVLLAGLVGKGPEISAASEALGAIVAITTAMPGTQVVSSNSPAQTGSRAPESCPHGTMVWKETADYAGHFCPADRNDSTRCKARYVRSGKR